VLVIDVQKGLFATNPPPFEAQAVIARINSSLAKARAAGVPVIFVQHEGPPDGDWMLPETDDWQVHPDLHCLSGDVFVRKKTADAFYGTPLQEILHSRLIQRIVVMGYATDFCVDSTVRNAASRDFEVCIVSDAHTTNDAPGLKASAIRDHFNWAWGESSSSRGIRVVPSSNLSFVPATK